MGLCHLLFCPILQPRGQDPLHVVYRLTVSSKFPEPGTLRMALKVANSSAGIDAILRIEKALTLQAPAQNDPLRP